MFLMDKLKLKYGNDASTSISIETKSDIKEIRNLLGIYTSTGGKWFVYVDLDRFKEIKELLKLIESSTTCLFFVVCSKYSQFKQIKEGVSKQKVLFDFYVTYLRRADLVYLYDCLTLSDNKLPTNLFNVVAQNYCGDIESVMNLLISMNKGTKISKKKDITDICGIGGNSTESFIFGLLKPLSGSDKGLKTVIKNRMVAGLDLCDSLGVRRFYNYLCKSLFCFIQIKQLLISGAIYKSIRGLPDTYDEKTLSRYNKFLWRLKEVPLSELLRIRKCVGNKVWKSELDFINFLYCYYYKGKGGY